MGAGALLCAVLEHTVVAPHHVAADQVLGEADAQRLLGVHVLARLGRGHGVVDVPAVQRADHHSVEVVALEHLAEVGVGGAADPLGPFLAAIFPGVAGRDGLAAGPDQPAEDPAAPAAAADQPDGHPLAGRGRALGPQRTAGNHVRGRHRKPGRLQKPAPREVGSICVHAVFPSCYCFVLVVDVSPRRAPATQWRGFPTLHSPLSTASLTAATARAAAG